jgi:D-glycero-D-manno-heptose 1,7-bisphosphate phosphatase
LTAYANGDRVTRDNLRIGAGGWVEHYDRTRTSSGLRGVDVGFALVDLAAIAPLPDTDSLFEEAVYPRLVKERLLRAFVTEHSYYSIGSLERLPTTARFLAREPTVILDRDGVLNEKPARAQYVRSWSEFDWRDGALDALRLLHEAGVRTLLATNQAGVARGALSERELDDLHEQMGARVAAAGGRIERIYSCLHGWEDGCACRKPQPGMLLQAQRDFDLDLSRTPVVGDDERDAAAAAAAGCPFLRVGDDVQLLDLVPQLVDSERLVT